MILKQPHQLIFRENKPLLIYEITAVMTDADIIAGMVIFPEPVNAGQLAETFVFPGNIVSGIIRKTAQSRRNCMSDLQGNIHGISGSFKLFVGHNEYFNGHNTPRKNMLFLYCIRNRIPWQEQIGEPINIFDIN